MIGDSITIGKKNLVDFRRRPSENGPTMRNSYSFRGFGLKETREIPGTDFDTITRIRSAASYFGKRNPGWRFRIWRAESGVFMITCEERPVESASA